MFHRSNKRKQSGGGGFNLMEPTIAAGTLERQPSSDVPRMVRAKSYQQAHRPAYPQCARRADRDSAVAEAIRHHRCEQSSVAAVAGARVVSARKDKGRLPPFVPVDLEMMNSPA